MIGTLNTAPDAAHQDIFRNVCAGVDGFVKAYGLFSIKFEGIGDGSVVSVPSVHFVLTVAIETGLPRRSCVAPRNDNDRSTTLRFDRCHCEEAEHLLG